MSQENVEIVRRCYEVFDRGEIDVAFETCARFRARPVAGDRYRPGHLPREFRRLTEQFAENWESLGMRQTSSSMPGACGDAFHEPPPGQGRTRCRLAASGWARSATG